MEGSDRRDEDRYMRPRGAGRGKGGDERHAGVRCHGAGEGGGAGSLDTRILPAVVGGVAVRAVQPSRAHAYVRAGAPVPEPDAADGAREAPHVVAERQRLYYHRRALTYGITQK